ncbi:electron transfer flavoprotein subunit alpha [Legionella quinlivanii]|uniref:Electron transfer flavoprotein subunit alpha n=1 Tax=Legionella quinlivanii TaxID=45073 RepID=A0A0W0Y472_9GAMM|nr:FAD-binding protein [Legionella quinlivanii]KTD51789.1 electron transfer flavoprotein subunit alpha [Legionella quinlivanii]MCW8451127.1 FAD-binding protein [Legionella quinlivanii]SEF66418.1 electron transfer flavoprotein alpha subunit apoprotein [Legionella quinlivanii DSM 21216]STY10683.1 electron transfer flavoprotein, alpha subuni [Legionella quinlivanii]
MSVLVIAEHDNKQLHPASLNTLAAALQLDDKPVFLVIGHDCQSVAEQASAVAGVHSVLLVDNPCYAHQLAENTSQLVASLAESFTAILAASTTFGKNILPRVAALLDVAQVSDVSRIISSDEFQHPIYAGNAIETVKILDAKKILTIRTTAFDSIQEKQSACCIERISTVIAEENCHFVSHQLSKSERPELGSAKIIVSGGRGLQNAEKFKLIEELADVLGAAVGASRAAVDAGFVPNDYQVGQTGKVVAPDLYFAIGISGAVQHLAGMKDSKVIVAINKDEDAPIFQIATYGLVGDLFELIPQLIEQLKQ